VQGSSRSLGRPLLASRFELLIPFTFPQEFAAIVESMLCNVPDELSRFYRPKSHDSFKKGRSQPHENQGIEILV
jgi:hypothetical protein